MLLERRIKKLDYDKHLRLPDFPETDCRKDPSWKVKISARAHLACSSDVLLLPTPDSPTATNTPQISPLPPRLHRRHLDLGDVSPADTDRFLESLKQV